MESLLEPIAQLLRSELGPIRLDLQQLKQEQQQLKQEQQKQGREQQKQGREQQKQGRELQQLHQAVAKLDKGQGLLWEAHMRPLIKEQFGQSFSKQLSARSLLHIAKRICSAMGWTEGSEVDQIVQVAHELSTALISSNAAEKLLRSLVTAMRSVSATAEPSLRDWSSRVLTTDPWISTEDRLDTAAIGRSLGALPSQSALKAKLGSLLTLLGEPPQGKVQDLSLSAGETKQFESIVNSDTDSGIAGAAHQSPEQYLTTCASPGLMLALFQSGAMTVSIGRGEHFEEVTLPYSQLQMDVRGKLRYFRNEADVDVGEIKRNSKSYAHAKMQLVQRAKLFKWAMMVAKPSIKSVRCTGHLFVPLVNLSDEALLPQDSLEEDVSIMVHSLN